MTQPNGGLDTRDAATFIVPGVVGIGVGVFAGTLVSESILVIGVFALPGAVAGHAAGYLVLRETSDRFS